MDTKPISAIENPYRREADAAQARLDAARRQDQSVTEIGNWKNRGAFVESGLRRSREIARLASEAVRTAAKADEHDNRHLPRPKEKAAEGVATLNNRIAAYARSILKPGDLIDIGGNSPCKIKRVNAKTVTAESGETYRHDEYTPAGVSVFEFIGRAKAFAEQA